MDPKLRADSDLDRTKVRGMTRRILSADTLTGDKVRNAEGEDLGKLEDIMLDLPTGRIAYAVLKFGGLMSSKLFAVPWQALTVDEENKELVLNVDKEKLKNAPGFDKDNWPDMADAGFGSRIFSYYGYEPYWGEEDVTEKKTLRGGGGI